MGAAVSSTVIYITMKAAIQTVLKDIGVEASLGTHMFATLWLAVSLSIFATIGWLPHLCCCMWL
jgi:F0F1-type ATP synthase membrane subunit c/vacuolar-type H+-ATPase subunit K